MRIVLAVAGFLLTGLIASSASAATYQVGPTRTYKKPADVLGLLKPGDVVELDAGTYASLYIGHVDGTAAAPITLRGVGGRPVLKGGDNVLHVESSHWVFENLDITGGLQRGIFHHGDAIVIRNVVVHDNPNHGLLGADNDSGSLLLELSEFYRNGASDQKHQIYMATDEVVHPGAVFRMQHCYVHDGTGGIGVKSRAERNEIYYSWFEGNVYYDIQPIGSQEAKEDEKREDSDIVGNVFVRKNEQAALLLGGDGTAQSFGRYRIVNNTFVAQQVQWGSPAIRIRDGLESVELHNNVLFSTTAVPVDLFRFDAIWVAGRAIAGSNNWVQAGAQNVPPEWTNTVLGADPGFTDRAAQNFVPTASSPLVGMGGPASPYAAHPFPKPLPLPAYVPTRGLAQKAVPRLGVGVIDIGAFEAGGASSGVTTSSSSANAASTTSATSTTTTTSSGSSSGGSGSGGGGGGTEDPNRTYWWPIAGATMTLAAFMAWLGKRILVKKP